MNSSSLFIPGLTSSPLAIIIAALFLFMHAMFAWGVFKDSAIQLHHYQRPTYFVSGYIWALATLLGGIFTAAIYWVIHCSTLRPQLPPPGPDSSSSPR